MATAPPNFMTAMTSAVGLSQTTEPLPDLTTLLNVVIPAGTTTPIEFLYKILYQVAFADTVHDDIIVSQQKVDSCTHNLQCNFFNEAMPQILPPPPPALPPGCKPSFGGLNIGAEFKTKHGCEEAVWQSIVYKGHDFTGGSISDDIRNGVNTIFTLDVPNIKVIFSDTMSACDNHTDNPDTSSPAKYAIKTVNNKVYEVRKIRWHFKKSNEAIVTGAHLAKHLGVFTSLPNPTNIQTAYILYDADNVGVIEQFKTGAKNDENKHGTIYYLMLPEYMADSANKRRWKIKSELCCGKKNQGDKGVKMLLAGKIKSEYPAWSENNRNTFFSKFSCSMEVEDFTAQTVRQEWYRHPTPTANLVQTISDSCNENGKSDTPEKKGVPYYLKNLSNIPANNEKKQLAFQRKRSGDQMQALAIKRLGLNSTPPDSEYLHVSHPNGDCPPDSTTTAGKSIKNLTNIKGHTWLITHDLTLCSYALFLGINVLHTNITGTTKANNQAKTITSFRLISPPGNDNFN
jgi:hypothetical protein